MQVNRFLTQSGMRKEQVEREMERAYEKYFSSLAKKEGGRNFSGPRSEEQAKEEQWERMTNPHLFGGSSGGGFRKVKVVTNPVNYVHKSKLFVARLDNIMRKCRRKFYSMR